MAAVATTSSARFAGAFQGSRTFLLFSMSCFGRSRARARFSFWLSSNRRTAASKLLDKEAAAKSGLPSWAGASRTTAVSWSRFARCPGCLPAAAAVPKRPKQFGAGQGFSGGAVRVADGYGAIGQTLLQPGVGVDDGFPSLGTVLSMLGFDRDAGWSYLHLDIDAPVPWVDDFRFGVKAALPQFIG